ncbi:MarR family winged helix-turn-helix transcriptional regulator [Craterilacuibacter sp.]|uniref:MarR family winged helix-turn-helix transcriptional regulator n=1 Tax=Craterilacuibacter sp. TaxID=2870909 RepID=UPI003F2F1F2F
MPYNYSNKEIRHTMAAFFHAYQAFTAKPDQMLAERGLARVHHRILFFVALQPGLNVGELLQALGVSKQAINLPLRRLIADELIAATTANHDRRVKTLRLSPAGQALEQALYQEQQRLLTQAFEQLGPTASAHWLALNQALAAR